MVLVIALMVMVILSLLAGFATTVSMTERHIAANDEVYAHNFYAAEAVCVESSAMLRAIPVSNIKNRATWGTGNTYPWLEPAYQSDPDPDGDGTPGTDLDFQANWPMIPGPQVIPANTALPNMVPPGSAAPDRIQYAAQGVGVTQGPGNITSGQTQIHSFALYGMYDVNRGVGKAYHGKLIVSVGYNRVVN